jgi:purine-nucleoside phosphorylase
MIRVTPHINANNGDFAKTVLMPGDPLRSKFVAENYFDNPVLVNNIRGIQGYTGTYKGVPVSVMASGMGMPSIGIYSYELFNVFGVMNIIRIGSAGALKESVKIRDIVIGMGACTDSNFAYQYRLNGTFSAIAGYNLLSTAVNTAHEQLNTPVKVGNILSSDVFYGNQEDALRWGNMGVLALEMESYALYSVAAQSGKQALSICTISDSLITGEKLSAEDRQTSFESMIVLALATAVKVYERGKP